MYLFFYRMNEFVPLLSLTHLWKIYELDQEYAVFKELRDKCHVKIQNMPMVSQQVRQYFDQVKL